ncbi:MAG: peptidoglycan-binding protein [Oscillospiraceae bacterium]|jgi:peptidoglycan hydrolase-like protein with peptidoglycan-binding domain|nr:peptidoglycan-binding protein [Oscillospiraceae bacterium]
MGKGTLMIETRAADDALPISGVRVVIREHGRILADMMSDADGNTNKIDMEAPDREHTLEPNDPGPRYNTVEVTISKPGFVTTVISNIPVFDGIEAFLPVHMMPATSANQQPEHFEIPPPAVEMPGERLMPGPVDEDDAPGYVTAYVGQAGQDPPPEPYILNEVIVPDYITVHLGTPNNTAARNIRVPFREYIKNVVSSEIFPTWPQASLLANIHAIVTFALNRVYTEWYRSRGFPFDITNSTQFDMAFVENRDIFSNISQLVDQYFNTYARRIGHRNPFFTEFCNGTTATCPGMSQWGTVTLANQGLTPLQILRRYYPNDLELVESNNFQSITESYPGTVLREGSNGPDVARMQRFLNRIRANYPLIPLIANPNGTFGPDTTAAVKAYQEIFHLVPDGVIGRATWFSISYIYVAVTKLAELSSEGERIGLGAAPPASVLQIGSRGGDVAELQFLINFISAFFPMVPTVIPDSVFGTGTRDAVTAFQRQFGLTPDGIVGPATWNRLYSVFRSIENEIPVPPNPSLPAYPGSPLRNGSRGEAVRTIQNAINAVAASVPGIPRLTVDGIFGNMTQNAVTAFQRQFGLTPDGIVGPITWERLIREAGGTGGGTAPPPGIPPFPGFYIAQGSVGGYVLSIQQALNRIAANYPSVPRVAEDSVFGTGTRNAVIAFQRQFGLTPDGIVGQLTWNRLFETAGGL